MNQFCKCVFAWLLVVVSSIAYAGDTFDGAVPAPVGAVDESFSQLTIKFPDTMIKADGAFTVSCSPAMQGYGSWANNDTTWTYTFTPKDDYSSGRLDGGTKCQVKQVADLKSVSGKTWSSGKVSYQVSVNGPNVTWIYPAFGYNSIRETDPVILIMFDGSVDRDKFFAEQSGFLSYQSSNAPSEKMTLVQLPVDQQQAVFNLFKQTNYLQNKFEDKNWILATIKQNLIPGAQLTLTVQGQTSAFNSDIKATKKFAQGLTVRSDFQAQIQCANPSAKSGTCLPHSPIHVILNGKAKWGDMQQAYIEYVPYQSTDGKLVRAQAQMPDGQEIGLWDTMMDYLSQYFPFLARFNDRVVDAVMFDVNIEPETQARVVLPKGLADIDGRVLSNPIPEFNIRIGTMAEVIHVPQNISFFEKNVPNLFLPVGVVNLNQKLIIRKSGGDSSNWTPIRDVSKIIQLVRAYDSRGTYRPTLAYTSPMETLGVANSTTEQQLTGPRNRPNILQFPFAAGGQVKDSGLYAIEVSSPTYEEGHSDAADKLYYNPKYVLAQVTDLAVHMKRGTNSTLAWVTSLSEAQPVNGATVAVYNCLGQQVQALKTNASGLVTIPNQKWASSCQTNPDEYSQYSDPNEFFVAASAGTDMTVSHSSWTSASGYPMSAPGIDFFYSNIVQDKPVFHAILGVNLVKPGQHVPVEIVAKIPQAFGFAEVSVDKLPSTARVTSGADSNVFYEFPLNWKNGSASFEWVVPSDSSVQLGQYFITLVNSKKETSYVNSDIEVAEFKIPLMSGIMAFPAAALVKPDSIPVNTSIRYANGVGAKKLAASISYYFEPTYLQIKDYPNFTFGSGVMTINEQPGSPNNSLPHSDRPATIEGLSTGDDGALVKDLASEKTADGTTISDVLKGLDRPQRLVVRVRYQDQMGEYQTLSQSKDIYNAPSYVGTNLVTNKGADAHLQAVVVDVNNKNVTAIKDLDIKVLRVETKVIGEELFGGLIKNTIERELQPASWKKDCRLQNQLVNCAVGKLKEGGYAFQVVSKSTKQAAHILFKVDTDGRVYGEQDYYGFGDDQDNKQLPLALNKKNYNDGDKAVVSFASPFKNCRALVTLERSDVTQSFVVPNACEKGFVEVPVSASQAPNIFVSVYLITGRAQSAPIKAGEMDFGRPTYRLGFANIKVNWSRFKSTVKVATDKPKYQPGETVNVQVKVKADEGKLTNSKVTLVAIEENIFDLKQNDTYKILDALMQLRSDDVLTVTPLEKVETVTAENVDLPVVADGRKGGDDGGDGGGKTDFKRQLFDALVAFQADVPVQNGVAKFSFKVNDSLTKFKIIAIATDASQKFGTGEAEYLTEKNTQTYSNIPTIARSGDTYPVKVTIQNNGKAAAKFTTKVEAVIKDAKGNVIGTKNLSSDALIASATSNAVDIGQLEIPGDASSIEYTIQVYDQNGKLVDSMQPPVQTVLPSIPLAVHSAYIAQVNGQASVPLTKEVDALADKGQIKVVVSSSLVGAAEQQIRAQAARDQYSDLLISSRFDKALLTSSESNPAEIKSVLETLVNYCDYNGFVKYYPQATKGSLWLTAHIVTSLALEPWTQKYVSTALSDRLRSAVSVVLTKAVDPGYVGTTAMDWLRARAIMAPAAFYFADQNMQASAKAVNAEMTALLQKDPNAYGSPVEKWSTSDLIDVWTMQVYVDSANALKSSFYKQLVSPSRMVLIGNSAELTGSPGYGFYYSDETMDTARLLMGHAKLKGDQTTGRALATGLVAANAKNGWYNTETLLAVSEALKSFGTAYESVAVSGSMIASIPEENATGTVDWSANSSGQLVSSWTHPQATVQVTQQGQGQPWVAVEAMTAVPLKADHDQGLSVKKQIRNMTHDSGFQAGDIVEVTLTLQSPGTLRDIVLQDPIPAGANILSDAYESYSTGVKSYAGYKFYFESLSAAGVTVKYQYQLNNPGTFNLPPTRAEGLYMPGVYGETPNQAMTVK